MHHDAESNFPSRLKGQEDIRQSEAFIFFFPVCAEH